MSSVCSRVSLGFCDIFPEKNEGRPETGTYRRGMIKLDLKSEGHGYWRTTSQGDVEAALDPKGSWSFKAGPLDANGSYYHKSQPTSGKDGVTTTTIRVQRCQYKEEGGCPTHFASTKDPTRNK